MKLKEYLAQMKQVIKDNPGALEWEVIYSSDSEGNNFEPVYYSPSVGHYSPDDGGLITDENYPGKPRNCICIN